MKISTKLVLAFVVTSSLIAFVGYLSYVSTSVALQDTVGMSTVEFAKQALDNIEQRLKGHIEIFQVFLMNDELKMELQKSNEDYAQLSNFPEFVEEQDVDWTNQSKTTHTVFMLNLVNNNLSEKFREHQNQCNEKFGFNFITEILVTNSYGFNVAQTSEINDFKQDDERWWKNAKEMGHYTSEIKYDDNTGIFFQDVALRINDYDGNFLGVAKYTVNTQQMFLIIDEIYSDKLFESEHIILFDKNSDLLYESGGDNYYANKNFHNIFDAKEINHIDSLKQGYFVTSHQSNTNKHLISFAKSDYQNSNVEWILIVDYELDDILHSIDTIRNVVLSISFIVGIGALVFGLYVSNSISGPIAIIQDMIKSAEKNDFSRKFYGDSEDELGQLGYSLQKMLSGLQKTTHLEQELKSTKTSLKNQKLISVGETASRLAHDLRNPLLVIKNEIEIMKHRHPVLSENDKKSQDRITRSVQRMSRQLDEVMDFVRIKPLDIQNHDLDELITNSINSFVVPDQVKINVSLTSITIRCDGPQLSIVLNNLIYNALQAVENTGEINIYTYADSDNIIIEIWDSGPGIPDNNLEKIFEPLYTTKQNGTGLGLASCKTIIENHGGTIFATNHPTKFTITLPQIIKKSENTV